METQAVVLRGPHSLGLDRVHLDPPAETDVVVDILWSGISTGTERLLWSGRMPPFPGMGYPLVPGYESVGRIAQAGPQTGAAVGDLVFVPGARCFGQLRGLFGGAAARLVVPATRITQIPESLGEQAVLLALAATAYHACVAADGSTPDLIVGHGVLGRLIARIAVALGGTAPFVWETSSVRAQGAQGYAVTQAGQDTRRDYGCIVDASGAPDLLDTLIARLARNGEIVLAGFYEAPLTFAFPPAFMREARIRVAAEWRSQDMTTVVDLVANGRLSLDGLITHRHSATHAPAAYDQAFGDPACLKMVLNWSGMQ